MSADGHDKAGLWVATANAQVRRFCERYGFTASGRTRVLPPPLPPIEETHYTMPL